MKRPELLIANGACAGQRFSVKEGGTRLGRASSNDIKIPDERLSRNHCLFELVGETGLRISDLASANGTLLNGTLLGGEPAELRPGDVIEAGETIVRVVTEADGEVDLGLGSTEVPPQNAAPKKRSVLSKVLWVAALVVSALAIGLMLFAPVEKKAAPLVAPPIQEPKVREVAYEKVDADSKGVFRYSMTLSPDGVLVVSVDDVPKENRHLAKTMMMDRRMLDEIDDILSWKAMSALDSEYAGVEPNPPALNSLSLRVVYTTGVREVRVINCQEPEAFRAIRERLEVFSKNELGIWALQYSRDQLVALAEESIAVGKAKWEDRDVQNGNLFAAVGAFRDAVFYLDTVNPKPPCSKTAQAGLEEALAELDRRFKNQRFNADRSISVKQWDAARRDLQILVEMIPDRNDERNREASAKLVDVEKRIRGGH